MNHKTQCVLVISNKIWSLFLSLFHDYFSSAADVKMIVDDNLGKVWVEAVLDGLRKSTKAHNKDNRLPCRELKSSTATKYCKVVESLRTK